MNKMALAYVDMSSVIEAQVKEKNRRYSLLLHLLSFALADDHAKYAFQ